ncbi:MAG: tyrosine-type recombinase/integrase [Desulfovibrionaceae bacterium]|nr:tyrosine-type recombinase/integrase [Desulfovibrionaceae bacterium]
MCFIEEFIAYLQYQKQYSNNTISAYKIDITQYATWLQECYMLTIEQSERTHIEGYGVFLYQEEYKTTSIRRIFASLKQFFTYLVYIGKRKHNPTQGISIPKLHKKLPRILNSTQAETILDITPSSLLEYRDLALLELLYGSGLRISEALNLALYDIEMKQHKVYVYGKGKKERIVPLTPVSVLRLQEWLHYREKLLTERSGNYVFLGAKGNVLSRREAQRIVQKYSKYADIPNKITPHIFRHSFATHLLENGADSKSVQELLGHSKLSTTQRYTQLSLQSITQEYHMYHPHSKLNKKE